MDKYTASEISYKNGFARGYEQACKDMQIKYWVENDHTEDIYCPECGSMGPAELPKGRLRFCSYCGIRLIFKGGV